MQVGLLPRSRRVGRKGKHQGSRGLYPVEAVRRINAIKKMMAEGHTLEDIKRSFFFHKNHIDQLERDLSDVFEGFQDQMGERAFGAEYRRTLEAELAHCSQGPGSWSGTWPGSAARSPRAETKSPFAIGEGCGERVEWNQALEGTCLK